VLPVESHLVNNSDDSTAQEEAADGQPRTGRWHAYETLYAQHIIEDFEAGTLPISEGTKLGSLLCKLVCTFTLQYQAVLSVQRNITGAVVECI
jgi:hypothetical protein